MQFRGGLEKVRPRSCSKLHVQWLAANKKTMISGQTQFLGNKVYFAGLLHRFMVKETYLCPKIQFQCLNATVT